MREKNMEHTESNQSVAEVTKTGRGGARAGAGRKKMGADEKKVTLAFRISPASKHQYEELKRFGVDVNERIEAEITRLAKAFGIE